MLPIGSLISIVLHHRCLVFPRCQRGRSVCSYHAFIDVALDLLAPWTVRQKCQQEVGPFHYDFTSGALLLLGRRYVYDHTRCLVFPRCHTRLSEMSECVNGKTSLIRTPGSGQSTLTHATRSFTVVTCWREIGSWRWNGRLEAEISYIRMFFFNCHILQKCDRNMKFHYFQLQIS